MLLENFTRREPNPVPLRQPFEIGDDALGPQIVRVAQRSSPERREAKSEDRADIAIARTADHSLTEGACGLIHDGEHESLQNFGGARAAVRMDAEESVHAFVDATFLPVFVAVEAAA